MSSLSELKLDLAELESLSKAAQRVKVQDYLAKEIARLRLEVTKLEPKPAGENANTDEKKEKVQRCYQEMLKNYAWDQSDKFMKLYLSLDSLSTITDENITSTFTDRSVKVSVQFSNKCSNLNIAKLCEQIEPKESYVKKKADYVLVMLKKKEIGKTWAWVTEKEKEKKDKMKDAMPAKDEDPGAGIQKMLKQMYDDGDDEMKRSIAKAFYESQSKQGGAPGNPLAGL